MTTNKNNEKGRGNGWRNHWSIIILLIILAPSCAVDKVELYNYAMTDMAGWKDRVCCYSPWQRRRRESRPKLTTTPLPWTKVPVVALYVHECECFIICMVFSPWYLFLIHLIQLLVVCSVLYANQFGESSKYTDLASVFTTIVGSIQHVQRSAPIVSCGQVVVTKTLPFTMNCPR